MTICDFANRADAMVGMNVHIRAVPDVKFIGVSAVSLGCDSGEETHQSLGVVHRGLGHPSALDNLLNAGIEIAKSAIDMFVGMNGPSGSGTSVQRRGASAFHHPRQRRCPDKSSK